MNRRAYLSATGLLLLAGCSTQDTSETTTSPSTSTPESTTTASSTTESPSPTTETQTSTPEPTEEPPTTETETEAPDKADQILTLAQEDLDDGVVAFADLAAPDGGFQDLNATIQFPFDDVSAPLFRARGHFGTLTQYELDERQRQRLARLEEVYWFLWWTGKTHESLNVTLSRTNNAVSRFYGEEYSRVDSAVDQITDSLEPAEESLDNLLDESSASSLDEIDELEPDDYDQKVDALEREISQFDAFADVLVSMRNGVRRLQRGFDEYLGGSYEEATETFFRAAVAFEDVSEALADVEPIEALDTYVEEFACLSDSLARGSDTLGEAATAGDLDIPERQTDKEDEAQTAFESCELTAEKIPSIPAFFDELPDERN
ncbi:MULTISPECIES: hypothetical protein [Haloferax]|uniref:Uncharacterized protein n=2 Tax=Haloferax TaxID=2251 RepID=A0A6G1YYT7_9EURY|nr:MULTISPECIES: hypothetical protein [Haloferax]KAB1186938.1 hypothetical protein Hfx1149_02395 [Haloferax sp. CBA1149]MRW79567.1 hypothetical protein [Haloferax marinisediminis]